MTKRWSEAQHLGAGWFKEHGWLYAEAVGNGRPGRDITGMPGLAPSVKAVKDGRRPDQILKEAEAWGGQPFVLWRPPGFGPATIAQWPVTIRLGWFTELLEADGWTGRTP
jgi:hypothetical protein